MRLRRAAASPISATAVCPITTHARPKSVIFTVPVASSIKFFGLMSRCKQFKECMYESPHAASRRMRAASSRRSAYGRRVERSTREKERQREREREREERQRGRE